MRAQLARGISRPLAGIRFQSPLSNFFSCRSHRPTNTRNLFKPACRFYGGQLALTGSSRRVAIRRCTVWTTAIPPKSKHRLATRYDDGSSEQLGVKVTMSRSSRLPKDFPPGTKYVLESYGSFVERYIEFPGGRRIRLPPRKASTCGCVGRQTTLVPKPTETVRDAPTFRPHILA